MFECVAVGLCLSCSLRGHPVLQREREQPAGTRAVWRTHLQWGGKFNQSVDRWDLFYVLNDSRVPRFHQSPKNTFPSAGFVQANHCNNVFGCLEEEQFERCTCYRDCGYDGEPVCGSDGQLYQNQCQMEVFACRNGTRIKQVPLSQCPNSKSSISTQHLDFSLAAVRLYNFVTAATWIQTFTLGLFINSRETVDWLGLSRQDYERGRHPLRKGAKYRAIFIKSGDSKIINVNKFSCS